MTIVYYAEKRDCFMLIDTMPELVQIEVPVYWPYMLSECTRKHLLPIELLPQLICEEQLISLGEL